MRRPEQQLQISVVHFLRAALRHPTVWTAFPAGGGGRVRGAFLKAMGLQPGWPDLLVIHPQPVGVGLGCIVVGIELKSDGGRLSTDQAATHADLTMAGARVGVCRSLLDVANLLRRHGVPVHAEVMGWRNVAEAA